MKNKFLTMLLAASMVFAGAALPAYAAETTASISFEGGEIILVSADNIGFESGVITAEDTEYDAENAVDIVIADNRGTNEGWLLTAELGVFTVGETQVLQNATITVNDITANKVNPSNTSDAPSVSEQVVMVAGSGFASPVATARSGQGGGNWVVSFDQAGIELAVKADTARAGLATARIDWLIADGA